MISLSNFIKLSKFYIHYNWANNIILIGRNSKIKFFHIFCIKLLDMIWSYTWFMKAQK